MDAALSVPRSCKPLSQHRERRRHDENRHAVGIAFQNLFHALNIDIEQHIAPLAKGPVNKLGRGAVIISVDFGPFRPLIGR